MQPNLSNWSTAQKSLFAIALIALLAASSFVALNLSNSGNNPLTPFWQVYTDGTSYYAKAPNGTVCWTTASADVPINNAIAQLVNGGLIHLGPGYFNISNTIFDPYCVQLQGEGAEATIIYLVTGANVPIINFNPSSYPAYHEGFAELSNLKIEGNKAGQTNTSLTGVQMSSYAIDFRVNDVFVENVSGYGWYAQTLWGFKATNLVVETCLQDGFYAANTTSGYFSGCRFALNTFRGIHFVNVNYTTLVGTEIEINYYRGFELDNASWYNQVLGGYVIGNSQSSDGTAEGILCGGQYNSFTDNIIFSGTSPKLSTAANREDYGLEFSYATGKNNIVSGNTFNASSYSVKPVYSATANNNTFSNNKGWITQNQGIATFNGVGTQMTYVIPHGLSVTPTYYSVTPLNSADKTNYNITADATNIYITYDCPLSQVTPTLSGWTSNPTNILNMVDGDPTTVTGYGSLNGAGTAYVQFDLKSVYTGEYGIEVGFYSTSTNTVTFNIGYSFDGSQYYAATTTPPQCSRAATGSEYILFASTDLVNARYVEIYWGGTAAATTYVRFYEFQDVLHLAPAIGTSNLAFSWTASG